jgi:hypothetical protein
VNAGRAALDARTDQALAHLAATRRRGGTRTEKILPAARDLAAALRVQFPGRDKDNARVLAAAASMLAGLEHALADGGGRPELIAPVLLDVLGYAAEDLNQDGRPQ